MSLYALAYKSRATSSVMPHQLEALLFDAHAFNAHHGVTGVLVVAQGCFFQYLEGPLQGVAAAFERVLASKQHADVEVLFEAKVPQRLFETWHMAVAEVPESAYLRLANADWTTDFGTAGERLAQSAPFQSLLAAWRGVA